MKYHIDKNGRPAECRAVKGKCPYSAHFSSLNEAFDFADRQNEVEAEYLSVVKEEEYITQEMKNLASKFNVQLEGLEYRTKTLSSTKEKILVRQEYKNVKEMYDVIRYTALIETDEYNKKSTNILKDLEKQGHQVVNVKNTWDRPGYKGINCKMKNKEGVKYELQFHTPESLEAKHKAHLIYQEERLLDEDDPRKEELQIEMDNIFRKIPKPY